MKNKIFLVVVILIAVGVFGGTAVYFKNQKAQQEEAQPADIGIPPIPAESINDTVPETQSADGHDHGSDGHDDGHAHSAPPPSQGSSGAPPPSLARPTTELIRDHNVVLGPKNAKVTIVEFFDPECEACRLMHPIVKKVLGEYPNNVRVVLRYMPFHGNSLWAASALEEARELGKFAQALDALYETQPEWGSHHNPKPELITETLVKIGIDRKKLDKNYLIRKHGSKVQMDESDGQNLGVRQTPTFFVNGRKLNNIGYEPLKEAVESALK